MLELRHGRPPSQRRAWQRVERILEAAAESFAELGYAKATTNKIAERAGVHVPSLYQYFANKDALLAELWDQHVGRLIELLEATLASHLDRPIRDTAELYVTAMLAIHAANPRLIAVLYAEAPNLPGVRNLRAEATAILVPYIEHHKNSLRPTDLETAAFILAGAVEGVARQAVIAPAPANTVLVSELTELVTAYLGVQ